MRYPLAVALWKESFLQDLLHKLAYARFFAGPRPGDVEPPDTLLGDKPA
jgi:hypothetical protein